jgi:hypothetical protein
MNLRKIIASVLKAVAAQLDKGKDGTPPPPPPPGREPFGRMPPFR